MPPTLAMLVALAAVASTTGAEGVSSTGSVTTTHVGEGFSARLGGELSGASGAFLSGSSLLSLGGGLALGFAPEPVPGLEFGWSMRGSRTTLSTDGTSSLAGQTVGDQRFAAKYVRQSGDWSFGGLLALDVPAASSRGSVLDTMGGELTGLASTAVGPVFLHGSAGFRLDRSGMTLAPNTSAFETYALQQSLYDRLRVAGVAELPLAAHTAFVSFEFEQPVGGPTTAAFGALPPRLGVGGRFAIFDTLAVTAAFDVALGSGSGQPWGLPMPTPARLTVGLASRLTWPTFPTAPPPTFDASQQAVPTLTPAPPPPAEPAPEATPPAPQVVERTDLPDTETTEMLPAPPEPTVGGGISFDRGPDRIEPVVVVPVVVPVVVAPPAEVAPAPAVVAAPAPVVVAAPPPVAPVEPIAPVTPPTAAELGAHFKLAVELQKDSAFGDAATELEFVAKYAPKVSPELLYNLGFVHRMSGDHDRALDEFSRFLDAVTTGPKVAEVEKLVLELNREKRRTAESGGDIYPPRIQATTPTRWPSGKPVSITATITDRTGVFEATLFYRFGGSVFVQVPLTRQPGTNVFAAALPPLPPGALDWYVDGVDAQGNLSRSGTAAHPHTLQFE